MTFEKLGVIHEKVAKNCQMLVRSSMPARNLSEKEKQSLSLS